MVELPGEKAAKLNKEYIKKLGFQTPLKEWEESTYLKTKQEIIDAYAAGNRTTNILRAYIYLTSLESDFTQRDILVKELCEIDPSTCEKSLTDVTISGIARDSQGKTLPNITVEVLGTKYQTITDAKWYYLIQLKTFTPAILRIRASSNKTMIGIKRINVLDTFTTVKKDQKFEKNFTLVTPYSTANIDTSKKTASGKDITVNDKWYLITTPFTKYQIPFDAIVKGRTPYVGKLQVMAFEFNKDSSSYLLDADVFDNVQWLASQLLVTYGMPYIIFTAEDWSKLDVLSSNPMTIWTSNRSDDLENWLSFRKDYQEQFRIAYEDSVAAKGKYPINAFWELKHGNKKIVPLFWVFDRETGYWDNVWFRFVTDKYNAPYNIETNFYTVYIKK